MNIHEWTIVPLEVGAKVSKRVKKKLGESGKFTKTKLHGLSDVYDVYKWAGGQITTEYNNGKNAEVYLSVVDSSICFMLYGKVPTPTFTPVRGIAYDIKRRRRRLGKAARIAAKIFQKQNKRRTTPPFRLNDLFEALSVEKIKYKKRLQGSPDYSFTFYVLETNGPSGQGTLAHELAHSVAINRNNSNVPFSVALTTPAISAPSEYARYDPYRNISGIATWSTLVMVSDDKEIDNANRLGLHAEVPLQSVWNRCHFFAEQANGRTKHEYESKLHEEYAAALLHAERFSRSVVKSNVSNLQREVNDHVADTSRVDDEIRYLSEAVESEKRKRAEDRRQWSYLTILLVLLSLASATWLGYFSARNEIEDKYLPLLNGVLIAVSAIVAVVFVNVYLEISRSPLGRPQKKDLVRIVVLASAALLAVIVAVIVIL